MENKKKYIAPEFLFDSIEDTSIICASNGKGNMKMVKRTPTPPDDVNDEYDLTVSWGDITSLEDVEAD